MTTLYPPARIFRLTPVATSCHGEYSMIAPPILHAVFPLFFRDLTVIVCVECVEMIVVVGDGLRTMRTNQHLPRSVPFPFRDGTVFVAVNPMEKVFGFFAPSHLQLMMLRLDSSRISAVFGAIAFVSIGRGLGVRSPYSEYHRCHNKRQIKIHTSLWT